MPYVVEVKGRAGQISERSYIRRKFYARGYSSEIAACEGVYAFLEAQIGSGATLLGKELQSIQAEEGNVLSDYECEAVWGPFQQQSPPAVGEESYSFEISGQQTKVVVPIGDQIVYKRVDDLLPVPTIHLIGDQGNGENPTGADVYEATRSASLTRWLAASTVTPEFEDYIESCVGKWNTTVWRGRQPGECLFLGASGTRRGKNDYEVVYRWLVRRNQADLVVSGINVGLKRGWDLIWPRYRWNYAEDGSAELTNQITHIVKAQIAEGTEFNVLGIGFESDAPPEEEEE